MLGFLLPLLKLMLPSLADSLIAGIFDMLKSEVEKRGLIMQGEKIQAQAETEASNKILQAELAASASAPKSAAGLQELAKAGKLILTMGLALPGLVACASSGIDVQASCLGLKSLSQGWQQDFARELAGAQEGSKIAEALQDWERMRAEDKACLGIKDDN